MYLIQLGGLIRLLLITLLNLMTLHQPGETTMGEPFPDRESGSQSKGETGNVSRRNFITGSIATLLGGLGVSALANARPTAAASPQNQSLLQDGHDHDDTGHGNSMMVGTVDHE